MGSTDDGYVNRNGQINLGRTNPPRAGTDHRQVVYVMHCPYCKENYGQGLTWRAMNWTGGPRSADRVGVSPSLG